MRLMRSQIRGCARRVARHVPKGASEKQTGHDLDDPSDDECGAEPDGGGESAAGESADDDDAASEHASRHVDAAEETVRSQSLLQ
jgi:hypothetical protein